MVALYACHISDAVAHKDCRLVGGATADWYGNTSSVWDHNNLSTHSVVALHSLCLMSHQPAQMSPQQT